MDCIELKIHMDRNNQKHQALYLTAENIIFVTPLITKIL